MQRLCLTTFTLLWVLKRVYTSPQQGPLDPCLISTYILLHHHHHHYTLSRYFLFTPNAVHLSSRCSLTYGPTVHLFLMVSTVTAIIGNPWPMAISQMVCTIYFFILLRLFKILLHFFPIYIYIYTNSLLYSSFVVLLACFIAVTPNLSF